MNQELLLILREIQEYSINVEFDENHEDLCWEVYSINNCCTDTRCRTCIFRRNEPGIINLLKEVTGEPTTLNNSKRT